MKRKYIVIGMLVLLVGAGTALLAESKVGRMGWHHGKHNIMQRLTRKFDLTQAQQNDVKQMWQSEKPTIIPLLKQLADGNKQMVAATANGNFDEAKVNAIAKSQSQTISQLMVEKEKLATKFYTILTSEQRTKFDAMRQKRISHFDQFIQRMATNQGQ